MSTSLFQECPHLGQHIIVDFYGIDAQKSVNLDHLRQKMTEAAVASGVTIIQTHFRPNSAGGVSGTLILSESHFIIHTDPEAGVAMLDLYTCGGHTHPEIGFALLMEDLAPTQVDYCTYHRGLKDVAANRMRPLPPQRVQGQGIPVAQTVESLSVDAIRNEETPSDAVA